MFSEKWEMGVGEEVTENKLIFSGIITCIVAFSVPIVIWVATKTGFSVENFNRLGPIGDFLGGTTVGLLSFASILFILSTIIMQRNELKQANKSALKTQNAMYKQQFEFSLLNMINQHTTMINNLELTEGNIEGKKIFGYLVKRTDYWYIKEFDDYVFELFESEFDGFKDIENLYKLHIKCRKLRGKEPLEYSIFENEMEYLDKKKIDLYNPFEFNSNGLFLNLVEILEILYWDPNVDGDDNILLSTFEKEFFPGFEFKRRAYDFAVSDIDYVFDNLFHNFKNIIRFIESYEGENVCDEVMKYNMMFISQLSTYEIYILKLEAIFGKDEDMKAIFNRYEILNERVKAIGGIMIGSYGEESFSPEARKEWLMKN